MSFFSLHRKIRDNWLREKKVWNTIKFIIKVLHTDKQHAAIAFGMAAFCYAVYNSDETTRMSNEIKSAPKEIMHCYCQTKAREWKRARRTRKMKNIMELKNSNWVKKAITERETGKLNFYSSKHIAMACLTVSKSLVFVFVFPNERARHINSVVFQMLTKNKPTPKFCLFEIHILKTKRKNKFKAITLELSIYSIFKCAAQTHPIPAVVSSIYNAITALTNYREKLF